MTFFRSEWPDNNIYKKVSFFLFILHTIIKIFWDYDCKDFLMNTTRIYHLTVFSFIIGSFLFQFMVLVEKIFKMLGNKDKVGAFVFTD